MGAALGRLSAQKEGPLLRRDCKLARHRLVTIMTLYRHNDNDKKLVRRSAWSTTAISEGADEDE
jgi:hypothetical protein